jgi:uncharacterized protein (UPF0248 family)
MSDNNCTGDLCASGVKELTVEDLLDRAEARDMDEQEYLLRLCSVVPLDERPKVAAFLDGILLPPHQRPLKVSRLVELTKRRRGRPLSRQTTSKRFWGDPNHVAALLASEIVKKLRQYPDEAVSRYKIKISDGTKRLVRDEALRQAVEQVARSLRLIGSQRKVNVDVVEDLLRRGRTRPPDLSGDD